MKSYYCKCGAELKTWVAIVRGYCAGCEWKRWNYK